MENAALERLISSFDWWMGISTVAVAIGILGEYASHFWFTRAAKRHRTETAVSLAFGALVFSGVVGECICGSKISTFSEQLQRNTELIVASLNKQAAEAQRDAAIARKEADSFEKQIAEASKDVKEAKQSARESAEKTAGINILPNGQTLMGAAASGKATLSRHEAEMAQEFFRKHDSNQAFIHIKKAIELEETSHIGVMMVTGGLNMPLVYAMGAEIAQANYDNDLANEWAKKSTRGGKAENYALYATTLFNLGHREEAQKALQKAVNMNRNKSGNHFVELISKIGLPQK